MIDSWHDIHTYITDMLELHISEEVWVHIPLPVYQQLVSVGSAASILE